MTAERRSQMGLLAAWSVSRIVACIPFNEARLDPNEDNPFKEDKPEDEGLRKAKEFIAKARWRAVCRASGGP